jgi:hypothetical protein
MQKKPCLISFSRLVCSLLLVVFLTSFTWPNALGPAAKSRYMFIIWPMKATLCVGQSLTMLGSYQLKDGQRGDKNGPQITVSTTSGQISPSTIKTGGTTTGQFVVKYIPYKKGDVTVTGTLNKGEAVSKSQFHVIEKCQFTFNIMARLYAESQSGEYKMNLEYNIKGNGQFNAVTADNPDSGQFKGSIVTSGDITEYQIPKCSLVSGHIQAEGNSSVYANYDPQNSEVIEVEMFSPMLVYTENGEAICDGEHVTVAKVLQSQKNPWMEKTISWDGGAYDVKIADYEMGQRYFRNGGNKAWYWARFFVKRKDSQ